jgi:hypothetical protein
VLASSGGEVHDRLNDWDEIVFVNEAWGPFPIANGNARLDTAEVLGRPLWEFISDPTTRQLYRDILKLEQCLAGESHRKVNRTGTPPRTRAGTST